MTNFAYLRVSTDRQDVKNQKLGVLDYCNSQNLNPIKFIEEADFSDIKSLRLFSQQLKSVT